jgi:hypothetical protein
MSGVEAFLRIKHQASSIKHREIFALRPRLFWYNIYPTNKLKAYEFEVKKVKGQKRR